MTPLPHNPAITVIDLPEDVVSCEVYDKESLPVALIIYREDPTRLFKPGIPEPHRLPPGNYKLICLGNQATEEEAREIVEQDCRHCGGIGILIIIRPKEVCCGKYDLAGYCCGYPSIEPEEYQDQCPHCYATGKQIVDPSTYTASLRSLITSNGWKNPVFLRKEK